MKTILTFALIFLGFVSHTQVKPVKKYLMAHFNWDEDKPNKRAFYILQTEGAENEVFGLKTYDGRKGAENTGAEFYRNRTDSSRVFYNYFFSVSEGLNYMAENGWSVVSVYTQVISDYANKSGPGGSTPITTVSSQPRFCFLKE
jgi:hypothetical protein